MRERSAEKSLTNAIISEQAGEQPEHVYLRRPFGTFGGKPIDEPIRERTRGVNLYQHVFAARSMRSA